MGANPTGSADAFGTRECVKPTDWHDQLWAAKHFFGMSSDEFWHEWDRLNFEELLIIHGNYHRRSMRG